MLLCLQFIVSESRLLLKMANVPFKVYVEETGDTIELKLSTTDAKRAATG